MFDFNYLNIVEAYKNIKSKVLKTPLISNDFINNLVGGNIYFKLEKRNIMYDRLCSRII